MFTLPVGLYAPSAPSVSLGSDFSSPSGFETDYWDLQTQVVAGKYFNGASGGTATIDNSGGLADEVVIGLLNKDGDPYNSWEADDTSDSIISSDSVAGDFGADDFSMRFVYKLPPFAGQCVLMEKILFGGQPGWILFLEPTSTGFYINGSGGGGGSQPLAPGAMADGFLHVTSVSYTASTKVLNIKSDLYSEFTFVVPSSVADLSVNGPLHVGNGPVADTRIGLTVLFAGLCRGANARAYYDETVTLPPTRRFDFSSISNYETDYWDYQSQTVAGKFDNGVGSATLDNNGGLPNVVVPSVLNIAGDPYNSWEADSKMDSLVASDTTSGEVIGQDFSFRVVLSDAAFTHRASYLGKYDSVRGWLLYRHTSGAIYFLLQGGGFSQLLADATGLNDGNIHVISGLWKVGTSMMFLKSDAFAEVSQSSGAVGPSLTNTEPITIGSGFDEAAIGTNSLFSGIVVGANAQAYYDETVTLPPPLTLTVTAGLLSHVMADAGITKDGSDNVEVWADQSGNGNDWGQATLANKPQWVDTQQNGLPVIRFAGDNRFTQLPFLSNGQNAEIFAVLKDDRAVNVNQSHWHFSDNSNIADLLHFSGDSQFYEGFGNLGRFTGAAGFTVGAGMGLYNVGANHVVAPLEQFISWNAVEQGRTAALSSVWANPFSLGGPSATWNFLGDYAEVIVYDRVLTPSERNLVNGYLNAKWGLGL